MTNNQNDVNPWKDEAPWNEPSEYFKFQCRSCDYSGWVEDIMFYAFPPSKPGDGPKLTCPECEGDFIFDKSVPSKISEMRPD